ncbi:hypothetical protein IIU_01525 [Bacillus cereus VD133]|uniref:Uncharacterized protein n=1 Tax=Bacillus cereus VD133 TaxID=1053233 RepID=A0A9W5V445_BACCE|nr:hypothetical protein [Bacillus cereus]EOO36922.1 hypothetical protein IIU_01525 [Bacillus cereus VD133]
MTSFLLKEVGIIGTSFVLSLVIFSFAAIINKLIKFK